MMNMAYDRAWHAQVATGLAAVLLKVQHANHITNNDNNASANASASGYNKFNHVKMMLL